MNIDNRPIPGRFKEVLEWAVMEKETKKGGWVRLQNGDVIYRKKRDIVVEEVSNQ